MSFIDEVMSYRGPSIQLGSNNFAKAAISKTTDTQKEVTLRVEKSKIREVCISDAISFNMLNIYVNLIMKAGYKYIGDTDEFDKFFKNMQNYGDKSSLRRLKKELHRDRAQYGAAFLEFIPFSNGKGIADLKRINASRIDYARDKKKNVILNREGNPFGFIMDFGVNAKLNSKGDPIPKQLEALGLFNLKRGQIYLKAERIAVFPLYRLDNSFDYLGLIEPAFQDIIDRLEAAQIQINALKVKATSTPVITVGDTTHEPTPQMMDDANYLVENLENAAGLAMPKFMQIDTLEYKSLDIVEQTIKMLLSSSAAASGTPLALITGSGEATNRATLHDQIQMMISMLQSQVEDFVEDWNLLVLDRIKTENNFKGNAALVWEGIRYEDRLEELETIQKAFDKGAVSNIEYRSILKDKFNWEFKDDYEKLFGEFVHLTKFTNVIGGKNKNLFMEENKKESKDEKNIEKEEEKEEEEKGKVKGKEDKKGDTKK